MKHLLFSTVCSLAIIFITAPAKAQPVEAVPLSQPTYTLKNETDPMAMDPTNAAPSENVLHRGETQIAPPPPGTDDQWGTSYNTPADTGSSVYDIPAQSSSPLTHSDINTPPQPIVPMDAERSAASYPNNAVSGVLPTDESKFENRTFCTLRVSFASMCCGPDDKIAGAVKTYLDENADKLSYKTLSWGKEGEFDYCVDVPAHNNRARAYTGLKRLLPPKSDKQATVILTGKGFARVETKPVY